MRIAIVEGADAGWRGEAVPDLYGLVIDGREWVGDDLAGVLLVQAGADELTLLAASEQRRLLREGGKGTGRS